MSVSIARANSRSIIRGRGETIVGVAIATALMPPLAVVGYGIATGNMPVFAGAFGLFVTNFVTIALSATAMARFCGFGHHLSRRQSWMQTVVLTLVFVGMAVPLGISLDTIGREVLATSEARALLAKRFGPDARVTQLDLDFRAEPLVVRSVVITPRGGMERTQIVQAALDDALGRPVRLHLDQILLEAGAGALEAQREELRQASGSAAQEAQRTTALATMIALVTGIPAEAVTIDRDHRRATAAAVPLPGASLATYRTLETRAAGEASGWSVAIVPPQEPLPVVAFADNVDTLDPAAQVAVATSAWAAKRWNMPSLGVPGLPTGEVPERPTLTQRRALAVAAALRAHGMAAATAPAAGQRFTLAAATVQQ